MLLERTLLPLLLELISLRGERLQRALEIARQAGI